MKKIVIVILGLLLVAVAIKGCSKTTIRNEVIVTEEEEHVKPTRAGHSDSLRRDTTRHEIRFSPTIEAWVEQRDTMDI